MVERRKSLELARDVDPLGGGLAQYARDLRNGTRSAVELTQQYLSRIEKLNPRLRAFSHVDWEGALRTARAIDALLASGIDLGPLMGVPIAIKDVLAVEGMPTTAGSRMEVSDLIGSEGKFVKMLKRAGVIILGKAATVEFAIGAAGTNYNQGTPRNPWDPQNPRLAGGSSSGSAAATAAKLCAFSIGTDTGGSIRGPASFTGVFGLKMTQGAWPMDGIFPMSKTLDSLGFLARTAKDAAFIWEALHPGDMVRKKPVSSTSIGVPLKYVFDQVDASVADAISDVIADLAKRGAQIEDIDLPFLRESDVLFQHIGRTELLAFIGRHRYDASRHLLNPDTVQRIDSAMSTNVETYIRSQTRRLELAVQAARQFSRHDIWIGPSKRSTAPIFSETFQDLDTDAYLAAKCAGPTRAANILGLCAASYPVSMVDGLPAGLQIMAPGGKERAILEFAMALEELLGDAPLPDMNAAGWHQPAQKGARPN